MYQNFEKHDQNLKKEEAQRKDDINKASARKDDLQNQINQLNDLNEAKKKADYDKGQ